MLAVRDQFEMQIFIILPAAPHEGTVERRNILNRARAFLGASVKPDARTAFDGNTCDEIENGALVPPDGG
jgi:hypothetical protein